MQRMVWIQVSARYFLCRGLEGARSDSASCSTTGDERKSVAAMLSCFGYLVSHLIGASDRSRYGAT